MKKKCLIIICSLCLLTGCTFRPLDVIKEKLYESARESLQKNEQENTAIPADTQAAAQDTAVPADTQAAVQDTAAPADTQAAVQDTAAPADTQTAGQDTWQAQYDNARMKDCFGNALLRIAEWNTFPDGQQFEMSSDMDAKDAYQYAIYDVDGDGRKELIVSVWYAAAAPTTRIYDYNPASGQLRLEMEGFHKPILYSNGMVKVKEQKNEYGGKLYPYRIYTYDAATDLYEEMTLVYSYPSSLTTVPDLDGDDNVIFVEDMYQNGRQKGMTQAEYDAWLQAYLAGAQKVKLSWKSIDREKVSGWGKKCQKMFLEQYREKSAGYGTDLALLFMDSKDQAKALKNIEKLLKKNYGVKIKNQAEGDYIYETDGKINGVEVYSAYKEGPEFFYYQKSQLADVTVCGVYPGMPLDQARQQLTAAGLCWHDNTYYSSYMDGGFYVELTVKNGVVDSLRMGIAYTY